MNGVVKPKPKPPDVLPRDPAALLELALTDLAQVTERPEVRVRMSTWLHWSRDLEGRNPRCAVCLAGAVMLNRFVSIECSVTPRKLASTRVCSHSDASALSALDCLRGGQLGLALDYLSEQLWRDDVLRELTQCWRDKFSALCAHPCFDYAQDADAWFRTMRALAEAWRAIPLEQRRRLFCEDHQEQPNGQTEVPS